MILRREFIQVLALMSFQSDSETNEVVKRLAQSAGWTIPDARMQELVGIYGGIIADTRLLRQMDLGAAVPATVYLAE